MKGEKTMKPPIIPIDRASEPLIEYLMDLGILYTDETGIHAKDEKGEQ